MSLIDSATLTSTLTIDVRARHFERLLGMLALLGVAAATALLPVKPVHAAMFFMIASAIVATGLWWQGWLGGQRGLTTVSLLSDGQWLLSDAGHPSMPADLLADSRVGSGWLWLRWRMRDSVPARRHRSLLILRGDIAHFDLRRLIARLRLNPLPRQPAHADNPVRDDDF